MTFQSHQWSIASDMAQTVSQASDLWSHLRGARIFMTGGTGLIGTWLLEFLKQANDSFGLNIRVEIMSRSPQKIRDKAPHLANDPHFSFRKGDVLSGVDIRGDYSHFIHAATDASADLNEHNPLAMFDTVAQGTRWALEFAKVNEVPRVLFLSSGAVYGQQPWDVPHIDENWTGGPSCQDPRAAYAEAKRTAEMLCAIYRKQFGLHITTARIFAVVGPYLPIDTHFAIGNFIGDSLAGQEILIKSDGRAYRSYLYMSDVARWLLEILVQGSAGAVYNVGSEEPVSISELAEMVSQLLGGAGVRVLGKADPGWNPGRYIPSVKRIHNDLGLKVSVDLREAIMRTATWYGWGKVK